MAETKTKVICTIGPSSWDEDHLEKLMRGGMAIARFNFSHVWTPETLAATKTQMERVLKVRSRLGVNCELALDTKGPDIRIGAFKESSVNVVTGQKFTFYFGAKNEKRLGDSNGVYVGYDKLLKIVKCGSQLCLNDGHVVMDIVEMGEDFITAVVKAGGVLKTRKSLAAPGHDLELPFISPEDETDFKMGIELGVDWVMASAVMRGKDVEELRKFWADNGGKPIKIMSKIEDRIGLDNLDAIIKASDAIMVARGGLGTDIGLDKLPAAQKHIIKRTRKAKKLVVCATEMMESMSEKPNCTRAEASDVANAVWDGSNYVMLSGESAAGKYPVECMQFMYKIVEDAEKHKEYYRV